MVKIKVETKVECICCKEIFNLVPGVFYPLFLCDDCVDYNLFREV